MTVSKATLSEVLAAISVVSEVTNTLFQCMGGLIAMSNNDHDMRCTMSDFYQIAQVPVVVDCIDGTHIRIQAPCGDREPYFVNLKGYHSTCRWYAMPSKVQSS